MIKGVQQRSDLAWATGLVSRVDTAVTDLQELAAASAFNRDFLYMDAKDIRKKYGDEESAVGAKRFCETAAPLVEACDKARAKLTSHMRVG